MNNDFAQGYQEGFNQGMELAASRFSLYIYLMAGLFLLRIIIQLPFVRKRLEETPKINAFKALNTGTDVLAFFILMVLLHALMGVEIISMK